MKRAYLSLPNGQRVSSCRTQPGKEWSGGNQRGHGAPEEEPRDSSRSFFCETQVLFFVLSIGKMGPTTLLIYFG